MCFRIRHSTVVTGTAEGRGSRITILPWPWSPLLPPGSVKALQRLRCHSGRRCAGGWIHSERQTGKKEGQNRQRERSREVNYEPFNSSSLTFYSLYFWSSQHAAVTWSITGERKEILKGKKTDKAQKKEINKNKLEVKDVAPTQQPTRPTKHTQTRHTHAGHQPEKNKIK